MSDSASPVQIEELLAHAAWAQRLARRLVRDDATAEDIVQQTMIAGLRSPPTDRARIRAWMSRVVRNFAHEAHRTRTSRAARELRVARPESERLPPAALLERAEATRGVAAAVTRLSEPYRSTILRRYYEGLAAHEIAEHENVSVETVRTRIKRGVELLRGDLRARGGEDWALALAPLCIRGGAESATRALRHARRARTTRVAAVGAVAALVVATAWTALRDASAPTTDAGGGRSVASAPAVAPSRESSRRVRPRESGESSREATAASPSASSSANASAAAPTTQTTAVPTATVRVSLRPTDGAVAVPVKIVASPLRVGGPEYREWAKTFDLPAAGGSIDLPRTSPTGLKIDGWHLRVEHPDLVPTFVPIEIPDATAAPSAAPTYELPLKPAGVVLGVVRAPSPVSECAPWVAAISNEGAAPTVVDQSPVGADGEYRLRLSTGAPYRIVVAARGARPASYVVAVPVREIRTADPVALDAGGVIVGAVDSFDGGPAAGAFVSADTTLRDGRSSSFGPYRVTFDATEIDWSSLDVTTDDAGRFRFAGLRPAAYRVGVSVRGLTLERINALKRNVVPDGAEERFAVTAGAVDLRVLRDGAPLAGAELLAAGRRGNVFLTADAAGRTRLLGEPGAKYEIRLQGAATKDAPRAPKLSVVAPALGATIVESYETAPAIWSARLAVTLRGAAAPAKAGVALYAEGVDFPKRPEVLRDVACADGVVRLDALPAGRFRVVVRPGGTWNDATTYFVEQIANVVLTAGGETSTEVPLEAAGRLSLGARTPDGRWAAAQCVLRAENGEVVHFRAPLRDVSAAGEVADALSPSGPVVLTTALRPGAYVVTCSANVGAAVGSARVVVRAGALVEAVVELAAR